MEERASVMSTLSNVLEKLRQRHYDNEFSMEGERFTTENGHTYAPEDLTIIKTYRFEGDSDPADSSVFYLIEAKDGLIGYVMDVYGAASNHDTAFDDFVRQIKMEGRDEKLIFTLEHS
jgi:hypothetical protein